MGQETLGWPEEAFQRHPESTPQRGGIDPASWEVLAEEWRLTVHQAVTHFEEDRLEQEYARRLRRKARAQQPGHATLPETNICHICGRVCRARIGLISHLRTHSTLLS